MTSKLNLIWLLACGLQLSGCGGGSGSSSGATGTLTVGLTDAPVEMVEQVRLYLTEVTIKPEGGPPESYPVDLTDCLGVPGESDDCNPVDLLALQDGIVLTVLTNQEMPAGRYEWLRLEVAEEYSYIVEETGGIDDIEVRVPSARGLQLSGGFVILAGESTDIVMDWDAQQGLANPVGQSGYILKPSIRLIDMSEYGAVAGSVSECVDTAVIYVFAGDLIPESPEEPAANLDDIDNNDPNPLVTASVAQMNDASYAYEVNFLPVGTYTVALTCDDDEVPASDTDLDEANDVIEFINPQIAEVEDGLTEQINF